MSGEWGATPVDCFWLEATPEKAAGAVFPLMPPERVAASRELAARPHPTRPGQNEHQPTTQ